MRSSGTVVRDETGRLKLQVIRPKECEHCGMCKEQRLLLDLPEGNFKVGDTVDVDMPTDHVLRASALAYVLPLVLLFAGLLLGQPVAQVTRMNGETASIVLALVFMALGFVIIRVIAPHMAKKGMLSINMTPCCHAVIDNKKAESAKQSKCNGGV